jgi:energy-coupling factor transporter transmembrane protein EcfT
LGGIILDKEKIFNFISKHRYISLFVLALIVFFVFPYKAITGLSVLFLIGTIVLGIVFIFKRKDKHSTSYGKFKKALIAFSILFIATFPAMVSKTPDTSTNSSSKTTAVAHKTKHHNKKHHQSKKETAAAKESKKAEQESLALVSSQAKAKQSSRAASESASLASESSKMESESIASSMSESSSLAASSSSAAGSKAAASSSKTAASLAASQSAASSSAASVATANTNTTNTNTVSTGQGQIIGDSRSHIYHVPGQATYHLNPANAVYFSTEAQAQAAGYRKSLR